MVVSKATGENAQDVRFRNYGAWKHLNSDPEVTKILQPPIRKYRLPCQVLRQRYPPQLSSQTIPKRLNYNVALPTNQNHIHHNFTNRKDKNNGRYQTIPGFSSGTWI